MARVPGIQAVAIVGAGWMGSGIATICALGEYTVTLVDVSQEALDRCLLKVHYNLDLLIEAGECSAEDSDNAMARLRRSVSMAEGLADVDLVIEAVPENLEIKQDVFVKMEAAVRPGTILASNSSGLPTTQIAARCGRPDQTVGIHVFEPPFILRAVEVIRGEKTSDETFDQAVAFVTSIGSVPVRVLKDRHSFVINFLQQAIRRAAVELVEAGVTTEEDIVRAARHSFGPKFAAIGPYASRGGANRENQYEEEWLEEMGHRALEMLPIIRAARNLDTTDSQREADAPPQIATP